MAGYREFQTGEVLTAANVNEFLMGQAVMVFDDAAARNTALGTAVASGNALVEGMLTYNKDSGKLEIYNGTSWAGVSAVKKIEEFTSSGTWTVPAGVTYAIAHMIGGGGGAGHASGAGGNGGSSSVAFAGGTVTANGGTGGSGPTTDTLISSRCTAGQANSGRGTQVDQSNRSTEGQDAQWFTAGDTVTPGASITVTVGSGGTTVGVAGRNGGTGFVFIEYYE